MTVLDPSRRPRDVTPKRYITPTSHRVRNDPELNRKVEQAQFTQSQVYDTVLEHFDRHTALPFQAPTGKPSLCKWITSARAGNEDLAKVPVALARGAGSQARLAWLTKDTFEQDKAGAILAEQEKEDAIRRGEAPHPNDIPVPETKDRGNTGADYGVRNTVTTSEGKVLRRPDTSILEHEATALRACAKGRCKKHSRRYDKLYEEAKRLTREVDRVNDNCVGAGTPSARGSNAKKGLNRELNRARIGHLDRRVERRAVRTGTNTVVVHPGNTSITCNECGDKDQESRNGADFTCTECGYRTDADGNAAVDVKGRGQNIFSAWKATRERGRAGSRRGSGTGTAGEGGAWRSPPGQPQRLPLASKHHGRHQSIALSAEIWI